VAGVAAATAGRAATVITNWCTLVVVTVVVAVMMAETAWRALPIVDWSWDVQSQGCQQLQQQIWVYMYQRYEGLHNKLAIKTNIITLLNSCYDLLKFLFY
jgi:hypothetical protein